MSCWVIPIVFDWFRIIPEKSRFRRDFIPKIIPNDLVFRGRFGGIGVVLFAPAGFCCLWGVDFDGLGGLRAVRLQCVCRGVSLALLGGIVFGPP